MVAFWFPSNLILLGGAAPALIFAIF